MRFLFLIGVLLLPGALLAQSFEFLPGGYILTSSPGEYHPGKVRLRGSELLVVQVMGGKNLKLTPGQVTYARVGERKFVPAGGFEVKRGLSRKQVIEEFVEQLDSGQVQLLRYDYTVGGGPVPMMGGGGGMTMMAGNSSDESVFLLRRQGETVVIPIVKNRPGGAKLFREALRPYLAARPDLAQLLQAGGATSDDFTDLIHALNTGQPFVKSAPPKAAKKPEDRVPGI